MLPDLRYAWRALRHTPVFTTVALASLSAGMGLAIAVFTIDDQVLLRDLPVQHAGDLLYFTTAGSGDRFSHPMFEDFRDRSPLFTAVAARFGTPVDLRYNNRSRRIQAEVVSGTWFGTLGLGTTLGRGFAPADDRVPGGHSVAVLTYDFWHAEFGDSRDVLGKVVLLNGHPMTIIGVAARDYRGFDLGQRTDVLVPTMMKGAMTPVWNGLDDRRAEWLQVVGRLRPGVTVEQAEARLDPFYRALAGLDPESRRMVSEERQLRLVPAAQGISDLRGRLAGPLRIATALAALILIFACANAIGMLVARTASRQREMAIRIALGATRARLVRQIAAEGILLAVFAGATGLLIAAWIAGGALDLVSNAAATGLSGALDRRTIVFAIALALTVCGCLTTATGWRTRSVRIAGLLNQRPENAPAPLANAAWMKGLAVAEVALSLVLVSGAAVFWRSLHHLERADLGFPRTGLLSFALDPGLEGYSAARVRRFAEELRERLAAAPGVQSAAVAGGPALGDGEARAIQIAGYPPSTPLVSAVGPGYFATLRIPLRRGREFTAADRGVAIVNEAFAGGPHRAGSAGEGMEAIGVAGNARSRPDEPPPAAAYVPYFGDPLAARLFVYVRARVDPRTLFPTVYREVAQLDASLPVTDMRTMDEAVADALAPQRVMAAAAATLAGLAMLLAALGVYGLVIYLMARRKREIGIRMALGAGRHSLRRVVLTEVGLLTTGGIALGTGLALTFSSARDALSLAAAAAAVAAVVLGAAFVPAEQGSRVSAGAALRE